MGKVSGDLSVFGLDNLLQTLASMENEGELRVQRLIDDANKTIHITPNGIRLVATSQKVKNPIGEILIRTGKINQNQLTQILQEQSSTGRRLGDVIARLGVLTRQDIQAALREQVAEELYDLFSWADATFTFEEKPLGGYEYDSPLSEVTLESSVPSIVLEAARRTDELQRIEELIPHMDMIPGKTDQAPNLDDPNLDRSVAETLLPYIDGSADVERLIRISLYPSFQVLRTLYVLVNQKAIKMRTGAGITRVPTRQSSSTIHRRVVRQSILIMSLLPTFRTAIAARLRRAGFDVVEASRPEQIRPAMSKHDVDAAILDISIDTVDGLNACAQIRMGDASVPFIVLSANTNREAVVQAIKAGAKDYLGKPLNDQLLLERLYALFSSAGTQG